MHRALTSVPCITVTFFGVTSTLGSTARNEQTVKLNICPELYIDLFADFFLSLFRPLFPVFQYQIPSVAYYNVVSHYRSLVERVWRDPSTLLSHLCISGLDCQLLLGASV